MSNPKTTAAWVAAWMLHMKLPTVVDELAAKLPIEDANHALYRDAIVKGLERAKKNQAKWSAEPWPRSIARDDDMDIKDRESKS